MHDFTRGTKEERRLLHNLALRLRWARECLNSMYRQDYGERFPLILAEQQGAWMEVNSSFQAAKRIVYFGEV